MTKLEIYGVLLLILLMGNAACYLKGHADGSRSKANEVAADVLKANTKVDTLDEQLHSLSSQHAQDLANKDQAHANQLATALANVKPVIVRVPTAGGVQANNLANPTSGAGGQRSADGDLSASVNIASAELVFAGKYQTCRDSLATYKAFYAGVLAKVNHP